MSVEAELTDSIIPEKTIAEVAEEAVPHISILGVGGGGSNIVSWMKKEIGGARVIALNSDAQHLSITKADERILLGYSVTGGLGCGGIPEQGTRAAEESIVQIESAIGDSDLVFVTTTLGGGTGTGASPVVARVAKELGSLTLGVATIPFNVEGTRRERAKEGLQKLVDTCDSVIVVDNNSLRELAGGFPVKDAFAVANRRLADFIRNMSEALAEPGFMNLDFADMRAIMNSGGVCAIGFGEGSGDSKVEDAVEMALDSQLLDVGDIRKAEGALVYVEGGEDMTLEDINRAGELVLERVSPSARVTWGARVDSTAEDTMRATVVLAGVDSPFLKDGEEPKKKAARPKRILPKPAAKKAPVVLKKAPAKPKKAPAKQAKKKSEKPKAKKASSKPKK